MSVPRKEGFVDAFDAVLDQEDAHLRERRTRRGLDPDAPRSGLALSGGGIRAAAFGLGVIRALHARGRFQTLDYLSTVSGGGFMGAFVGWLLRFGDQVAGRGADVIPQPALRFIRGRANYLDPGGAGPGPDARRAPPTAVMLFAFTLGRTFLSLCVYGALLIGLFYVLNVGDALVDLLKPVLQRLTRFASWTLFVDWLNFATGVALVVLGVGALRPIRSVFTQFLSRVWQAAIPHGGNPTPGSAWRGLLWFLLGLVSGTLGLLALATVPSELPGPLSAAIVAILLGALCVWALRNCRTAWSAPARPAESSGALIVLPILAAVLATVALTAGLLLFLFVSGAGPDGAPASLSAWQAWIVGIVAVVWVLGLVPRAVPGVWRISRAVWNQRDPHAEYLGDLRFQRRSGATFSWAVGWLALGSVPWSARLLQGALQSPALHLYLLAGAGAILTLLLAGRVAAMPFVPGNRAHAGALRPWMISGGCAVVLYGFLLLAHGVTAGILNSRMPEAALGIPVLGLIFGLLAGLNFDGPGQIYRDRLGETFMPDPRAIAENRWYPALRAAKFRLSELRAPEDPGPYHLLNASIATAGSRNAKLRQRGADSFVLSALYCGSEATGWADTTRWLHGRLTLRDAVGISAGAVEPGAGVSRPGGERDPFVGATLALFNLQLGYWADNPNPAHCPRQSRLHPNLIRPGLLHGLFGAGGAETERLVGLSDGSHFENLGLYELLRRRLGLIVVADSSEDPAYGFAELVAVIELAREDLGIDVLFPAGALFPDRDDSKAPAGATIRGFAFGEIRYPDSRTGTLLYLKPALIDGLDATVRSFAAARPAFPQESTLNQNFDEDHFVAYERLGYQIALGAIDGLVHRESAGLDRQAADA